MIHITGSPGWGHSTKDGPPLVSKPGNAAMFALRDSLAGTDNPSQYLVKLSHTQAGTHDLRKDVTTYLRIHQGRFLHPVFIEQYRKRSLLLTTLDSIRNEPITVSKRVTQKLFGTGTQEMSKRVTQKLFETGTQEIESFSPPYLRIFDTSILDFDKGNRSTPEPLRVAISSGPLWNKSWFDLIHTMLLDEFEKRCDNSFDDLIYKGIPS